LTCLLHDCGRPVTRQDPDRLLCFHHYRYFRRRCQRCGDALGTDTQETRGLCARCYSKHAARLKYRMLRLARAGNAARWA
jgi:hypothetical protein